MKAGKPFLIAGVPIAGLALHSLSCGAGAAGVASAWTPSSTATTTTSRHRHRHTRTPSTSKTLHNNSNLLLFSTTSSSSSTNIDDNLLQSLNLTPELQMMTSAFASIPDEKTRHKQLLYMASKLPNIPDTVRVPGNKVPGCLSTVHVDCVVEEKKKKKIDDDGNDCGNNDHDEHQLVVNYFGDSDGLLTKGLLALLIRGLSGCTPEQINAVDPQFIQAAKISQTLTPGRNNGFLNMLAVMKKKATDAVDRKRNAHNTTVKANDMSSNTSATTNNGEESSNNSEKKGIISSFDPIDGKPMYNTILSTLITTLKPTSITLTDTSHQHVGHAGNKGWEESGESHFELMVVAEAFEGLNLVKRHKLIYVLLGEVMPKIHALAIVARSPSEVEEKRG